MSRSRIKGYQREERRRNMRRPTSVEAELKGHPVHVVDASLGGVGIGSVELMSEKDLGMAVGEEPELELRGADGRPAEFVPIEIVRTEPAHGRIGARFTGLSDDQFRLIELLIMGRGRL